MTHATVERIPQPYVRPRFYYGWVTLGVAALAMVATLPGRTQGLGLITEPLMRDLGLGRVAFAEINLVATLIGSVFCAGIGRWLDRSGSRVVLTTIVAALGTIVMMMSGANGMPMLLVCVTLTRGLGQSSLSVVSLAMVGKWFRRRLTRAMAVYAVAMSVGFMAAFPTVGALVLTAGWRYAWGAVGLALLTVVAPLAWLLDRSSPEAVGLSVDGDETPPHFAVADATLADALRSPAFWVFALATSLYGLVASGIGLFNESILAERGFAPGVYHQALAVTAISGLAGNFAAGALADRGSIRTVAVTALLILSGALVGLAQVATIEQVMIQAVAMGIAGGFVMVVFFSFWGRAYGRRHLGRIQGAAQAMTVIASAVGPLLLAASIGATGSYASAFYILAGCVALLALAALVVRIPSGAATTSTP